MVVRVAFGAPLEPKVPPFLEWGLHNHCTPLPPRSGWLDELRLPSSPWLFREASLASPVGRCSGQGWAQDQPLRIPSGGVCLAEAFSKLKQTEMWEGEGRRDGFFAGMLDGKASPRSASLMPDLGTSIPRVTTVIVVMNRIHFGSGCPHLPLAGSGKQSSAASEIINVFVK